MKKLLNTLGVLSLLSTLITSVVACGDPNQNQPTNLQNEMIDGAEFMSRLFLASRHENLNFNVNELLSAIITPESSLMRLPQSYVYNNEKIDIYSRISIFKKFLEPSLESLDQANFSATMASYIMGMYSNDFYADIINGKRSFNDTLGKNGETGINKTENNALGYLAGLNSELSLAQNQDRRNLAWGIQDNGALTNYLLNKGIDGAYPGDSRSISWGTAHPGWAKSDNGGTNASGYSYFSSILHCGKTYHSGGNYIDQWGAGQYLKEKFDYQKNGISYEPVGCKASRSLPIVDQAAPKANEDKITPKVDGMEFNEVGSIIARNGQENNVFGAISLFASMMENISTTSNGSLILGELANTILPVIVSDISADNFLQAIGFSLITNLWDGIAAFKGNSTVANIYGNNSEVYQIASVVEAGPSPLRKGSGIPDNSWVNVDEVGFNTLGRWIGRDSGSQKPEYSDDLDGFAVSKVIDAIDAIIADFENSNDQAHKTAVVEKIFGSKGIFGTAYSTPITLIGDTNWDHIINNDASNRSGVGAINLLKLAKFAYETAINPDVFKSVSNVQNQFKYVKAYRNLTSSQKQIFIRSLGYTGASFNEESFLGKFYKGLAQPETSGQKEFNEVFASLKDQVNNGMKEAHEKVLQYIFDDKYWKRSGANINTTSNMDLTGKLEFTLEYTGIGDGSSNASDQTTEINVPQNFNPYQTILKNQEPGLLNRVYDNAPTEEALVKIDKERISGEVLGVRDGVIDANNLANYDGRGLLKDYEVVKFEYKVKWENVSNDVNNPYWVISGIDSFKNGKQFYNIY